MPLKPVCSRAKPAVASAYGRMAEPDALNLTPASPYPGGDSQVDGREIENRIQQRRLDVAQTAGLTDDEDVVSELEPNVPAERRRGRGVAEGEPAKALHLAARLRVQSRWRR